eukprot:2294631-Pyramimonas_sp.AAC.1
MSETPDPRAGPPRKRRTERGRPRGPRPRSEAPDLSNLSGRSIGNSMRINAKCANYGLGCAMVPESRCRGSSGQRKRPVCYD